MKSKLEEVIKNLKKIKGTTRVERENIDINIKICEVQIKIIEKNGKNRRL